MKLHKFTYLEYRELVVMDLTVHHHILPYLQFIDKEHFLSETEGLHTVLGTTNLERLRTYLYVQMCALRGYASAEMVCRHIGLYPREWDVFTSYFNRRAEVLQERFKPA